MTTKIFPQLLFYLILCIQHLNARLDVIGELPQDGCLLKKFHSLREDEIKSLSPEYFDILDELRKRICGLSLDETRLHHELESDEALQIFGPSLGIIEDQNHIFSKSFFPEYYFIKRSHKTSVEPEYYFTPEELDEIYQTAERIFSITAYGDVFISLGQSPAYIVEALEAISSRDINKSHFRVIHKVPFSGAPDYMRLNKHYKALHLSNVITPQSLSYFKSVLEEIGISPTQLGSQNTVHIVDLVGSGGSLAAFLKILINWYRTSGISLPEFNLIDISVENRNFRNEHQVNLPLNENCLIRIDRHFIHTSPHLSDKLDYTDGEDRIIPHFGAMQWKSKYEHIYKQYPKPYAKKVIQCVKEHAITKENIHVRL